MQGPDRPGVGSIKLPAAIAADEDKSNVPQNAEVLRDGGLFEPQARNNVSDRTLPPGQIVQNFATTGLGDGVESV